MEEKYGVFPILIRRASTSKSPQEDPPSFETPIEWGSNVFLPSTLYLARQLVGVNFRLDGTKPPGTYLYRQVVYQECSFVLA